MIRFRLYSLLILASAVISASAAEPNVERSLIASGQGYFPVAMRLSDGRIAVVMRGGGPHLSINGRLDIVFSSDEAKTWSKPAVVVDSPLDDRNPALGQAADGTIVVGFWRTARYDAQGRYNPKLAKPVSTWITRSADGGKTWSEPSAIDVADVSWGSPYGRILTLPDGSMLMSVYGGAAPDAKSDGANAYVYQSLDQGKSWRRFSRIATGYNETEILRLASGEMLAALRSDQPQDLWLARSADGGKTWTEPKNVTPAKVHPADLLVLPDGRLLLASGYRVGPTFGVRAVVGSPSGDFDWKQSFVLLDDAASLDCGYPSSVVLKDGRVLTTYYEVAGKEHPDWGTHCGALIYAAPAR